MATLYPSAANFSETASPIRGPEPRMRTVLVAILIEDVEKLRVLKRNFAQNNLMKSSCMYRSGEVLYDFLTEAKPLFPYISNQFISRAGARRKSERRIRNIPINLILHSYFEPLLLVGYDGGVDPAA